MGIFVVAVGVLLLIVAVRGGLNCIWDGIALTFESDEAKKQAYLKDLQTRCLKAS